MVRIHHGPPIASFSTAGHNRPMDDNVPDDPLYAEALAEFARLFEEAGAAGEPDRTAMTVATATLDARPSARTVLLKAFDPRGFVFYTHMDGRKGRELQANPYAALLFHWPRVRQGVQVRIEGPGHTLPTDAAVARSARGARGGQVGAWARLQWGTLAGRATFEQRIAEVEARFEGRDIPRPPRWTGFRVRPRWIEFW